MASKLITSNTDLEEICKYFDIDLVACIRKKQLMNITKRKQGAYIINLDDENNGSHWVGFYIYQNQMCYYDSFGGAAPDEVLLYSQGIFNQTINFDVIQNLNNDVLCGFYVIAFLYDCMRDKKIKQLDDILVDHVGPYDLIYPKKNIKILQMKFKKMISQLKNI